MFATEKEPNRFQEYFHGDEWHTDANSALTKANDMKLRKIASLKKQLAKVEAMTFLVPE